VWLFDRAHISECEFNQRLRAPRSSHELDLDSFWRVHLNHCAQIAATKAVFRQVARVSLVFVGAHEIDGKTFVFLGHPLHAAETEIQRTYSCRSA